MIRACFKVLGKNAEFLILVGMRKKERRWVGDECSIETRGGGGGGKVVLGMNNLFFGYKRK